MTEREPLFSEGLQGIQDQLEQNAYHYIETDPANLTLGYFAKAALIALKQRESTGLYGAIEHMLQMRPNLDAPHAVKLLERGYQADLLHHDDLYPYGYQNEQTWLRAFSEIDAHNDFLRWGILANNIALRSVQSNVSERYKTTKLVAGLIANRFDRPVNHLEVGSSRMHGSLKLLYEDDPASAVLPFREIEVVDAVQTQRRDERLTRLGNLALLQHVDFGAMMGNDITNIDDEGTIRWALSCSFYPDELTNKAAVADYKILDNLDPSHERVRFFQGDFAQLDRHRFKEASPVEEWDIITFSTVFYQVSKQERLSMLVNAASVLSENGLIIIQDAQDGNFSKPYNYTASVIDNASTRNNPEVPLLVWENGRCNRAAIGEGRLVVDGRLKRIDEALEDRYGESA